MSDDAMHRRAEALLALHHGPDPLLLPNAWDVVSARLFEQAGFPAVATTSPGVAWALGYPDGERIPRDEMLQAVGRIARALDVPMRMALAAVVRGSAELLHSGRYDELLEGGIPHAELNALLDRPGLRSAPTGG